jgi:hypothetical protein
MSSFVKKYQWIIYQALNLIYEDNFIGFASGDRDLKDYILISNDF